MNIPSVALLSAVITMRCVCQRRQDKQAEFIKIVTWIDANAPYYGTRKGYRDPKDKDHPDFRIAPLIVKN